MDPYEILGVHGDATIDDIKKNYKNLSKLYHPDRPDGDVEQFKKIAAAYEILNDPDKRGQLDLTLNYCSVPISDIPAFNNMSIPNVSTANGTIPVIL